MTVDNFYSAYMTAFHKQDTTIDVISTVDTTINGEEAIKLTHLQTIYAVNNATRDTIHLDAKIQKYFMMNNSYGYVLSFNALIHTFNEYKETFDEIVATFKFKE